jgi:DNA polymerase (family 10)
MTDRIIKALEHPNVTMLGHVSGRLLLKREASKMNIQKIIDAAIANHKIIELNSNPMRLDMDWRYWKKAAEKGLVCAINPDAHALPHYDFQITGVNIARKGWLTRGHVFNTRSLQEVREYFG